MMCRLRFILIGFPFALMTCLFMSELAEAQWGQNHGFDSPTQNSDQNSDQNFAADPDPLLADDPVELAHVSLFQRMLTDENGLPQTLFDHFVALGIPQEPLTKAFKLFDQTANDRYRKQFKNRSFLTIINSSMPMNEQGFWLLDLKAGTVDRMAVSHGRRTDVGGKPKYFSNRINSFKTSIGGFLTGRKVETHPIFGKKMNLYGISPTNSNAFARGIWVHEYDVGPEYNQAKCRRREQHYPSGLRHPEWCRPEGELDEGCFGIPRGAHTRELLKKIKGGSLIYAFASQD